MTHTGQRCLSWFTTIDSTMGVVWWTHTFSMYSPLLVRLLLYSPCQWKGKPSRQRLGYSQAWWFSEKGVSRHFRKRLWLHLDFRANLRAFHFNIFDSQPLFATQNIIIWIVSDILLEIVRREVYSTNLFLGLLSYAPAFKEDNSMYFADLCVMNIAEKIITWDSSAALSKAVYTYRSITLKTLHSSFSYFRCRLDQNHIENKMLPSRVRITQLVFLSLRMSSFLGLKKLKIQLSMKHSLHTFESRLTTSMDKCFSKYFEIVTITTAMKSFHHLMRSVKTRFYSA